MPVREVSPGRWQWGRHGKVYASKAAAERQARAIYASGYREDIRSRVGRQRLARQLAASRAAESAYVLELLGILGAVHRSVLAVANRLAVRQDAQRAAPGLSDRLLVKVLHWQTPRVEAAFARMANGVSDTSQRAHALIGINPRHVVGVESVIEHAREENVKLITNASRTFLDQVRGVLEETEGRTATEVRKALEERVQVSRSRAELIARDQTLKLNSQIAEHRQRSAGVARYVWSTSLDERVRPMHRELEGEVIDWNSPPVTNEAGERNHAGQDIQCRCVALPYIDELENEEPDEPEEEAPPEVAAPPPEEEEAAAPLAGDLDRFFRAVVEDPKAEWKAAEIVEAMPSRSVAQWMKEPENQPSLAIRKSIKGRRRAEGFWQSGHIELCTEIREPRALKEEWGKTWRVADKIALEKKDLVQNNFVHELGHHVHLSGRGAAPSVAVVSDPTRYAAHVARQARIREIDAVVQKAFAKLDLRPKERADILRGVRRKPNGFLEPTPAGPAISRYAHKNAEEYFAESFNAYMVEPKTLEKHDPSGYRMVEEVLELRGIRRGK